MARIIFHGAAQQVTGSHHILEANGRLIALDCGMFQGPRAQSRELNRRHAVEPRLLHAVVVSHAHIDHTGRLPMLVRDGFEGVIHSTPATRDLSAIMLADSAHIQEEDAKYLNKRLVLRGDPAIEPLYTVADVVETLKLFQTAPYGRWFKVASGIFVRYFEAGHMLGSAGIEVEINEPGGRSILVFSGDVGRFGSPLLRDPVALPPCDYLICESTYGGRNTDPVTDLKPRLAELVQRTIERKGRVIIPAFSVGRTQTIIYYLRQLFATGDLPEIPVYVDSPLAINATEVYRLHPECFDREARDFIVGGQDMFSAPNVHYLRAANESKQLNASKEPCIVIAASGMCEAGRILHHLKHGISNPRNTVLIVGFQGAHTLGRRIVENETPVRIFGEWLNLEAEVAVINGFSAHADARELRRMVEPLAGRCRQAFLVHGEVDQSTALVESMKSLGYKDVRIPAMGDRIELTTGSAR